MFSTEFVHINFVAPASCSPFSPRPYWTKPGILSPCLRVHCLILVFEAFTTSDSLRYFLDAVGPTGDWRHTLVRYCMRSSYDTDPEYLTTVSQFRLQSAVSCAGSWVIHKQNTVLRRVPPALCGGQVGGRSSFIVCLVGSPRTPRRYRSLREHGAVESFIRSP